MRRFEKYALSALLIGAAACQVDLEDISQVSKFRVLTVQADQPELNPGESTQLRVLTADPVGQGRKITAAGFVVAGLLTPSSSEFGEDFPFYSPLAPVTASEGVITFDAIEVPDDADQYFPAGEQELKATAVVLICAGDDLSETSLLETFGQQLIGGDPNQGVTLDLAGICTQAGAAEGLTAFKTITISNRPADDPLRNSNPTIDALKFNKSQLAPADHGAHGVYLCKSSDGCREGVPIEIWLTADSYQQYEKVEFGETKLTDERIYISWFVDGGRFDSDRSGANDPLGPYEVHWLPPRRGGIYTMWAVAHDIRGGVSWQIYSVEAISDWFIFLRSIR